MAFLPLWSIIVNSVITRPSLSKAHPLMDADVMPMFSELSAKASLLKVNFPAVLKKILVPKRTTKEKPFKIFQKQENFEKLFQELSVTISYRR